jgi:hypothetical protein
MDIFFIYLLYLCIIIFTIEISDKKHIIHFMYLYYTYFVHCFKNKFRYVQVANENFQFYVMTFLGLGSLCELMDKKKYYTTVGVSALLIPAAIWWGMPDLMIYGGLSGLDCALWALLMVMLIKREIRSRSRIWVAFFSLLLVGLIAKITYETVTGMTIFVSNNHYGMVPVPLAHLIGGIVGTGIGLMKDTAAATETHQQCPIRHSFLYG